MRTNKTNNILLSIKTEYANKILDGSKRYEFRGWKLPDNIENVYIYSSGIQKKIVGKFQIEKVIEDTPENIWEKCQKYSGVLKKEFFDYVYTFDYNKIYAIKVKRIELFSNPLFLSDALNRMHAPQRFKYLSDCEIEVLEGYL